ncbi:hypothetical protein ACLOJK_014872, partial [Asimina triloba]
HGIARRYGTTGGVTIGGARLDIDQMIVLIEWCVIGVVCRDIPPGSVLRQVHQVHNSRKTRIGQQEDRQYDSRMCKIKEGGSRPMYSHLTLSKHKSRGWSN